mmetsp:Transcript_14644/g.14498  ORF Transcript_14644/g.14498 Transcript_14644/m.14498 type:complete len:104 (-) Transcript_14644:35-346(-)
MKSHTVIDDVMNANVSRTCQQQVNNVNDSPDVQQYKDCIVKLENAVQMLQQQSKEDGKGKTDDQNEEVASNLILFKATNTIVRIRMHVRIFIGSNHGISVKHS